MFKNGRRAESKSQRSKKSGKNCLKKPERRSALSSEARLNFTNGKCKITQNTGIGCNRTTSKRVLVPFKLFSQGVKSETARKNTGTSLEQQTGNFLNEDLHSLLHTVSKCSTRRKQSSHCFDERYSARTSSQSSVTRTHYPGITDYYMKLESQQELTQGNLKKDDTNRSSNNSVFKKINYRYENILAKQKTLSSHRNEETTTLNTDRNLTILQSAISVGRNYNYFCKNLEKQLATVTINSKKIQCIQKITTIVAEIDAISEGRGGTSEQEFKSKTTHLVEEITPAPIRQLIPKSNWLYKTPHTQKVKQPIVNSYSSKLRQCILQKNCEDNKAILITNIKNSFYLDKKPNNDNCSTSDKITITKPNNYSLDHLSFVEKFQFSQQQAPKATQTNLFESIPVHSKVSSLLNSVTIPVFGDIGESMGKVLIPTKKEGVLFSQQTSKVARRTVQDDVSIAKFLCFNHTANHQLFSIKHLMQVESIERSEKCNEIKRDYLVCSHKKQIPSMVTSETYCRPFCRSSCGSFNKENYRPHDFSNHPDSSQLQTDPTIITNEQFLLPPMPLLDIPSPLPFPLEKAFEAK